MASIRKFLLPFSWLYGGAVVARNFMYNKQWKKSVEFELPVIAVGNLSAGGTGKTPHTEYLTALLQKTNHVGIISRGYGRSTTGYTEVTAEMNYRECGDEPLQMKRRFPDAFVAVCEERAIGIPMMLMDDAAIDVVLMDDAFQHRAVQPSLSLLLTSYHDLFTRDALLPAGNLREQKSGARRADAIIVTKTPDTISSEEKQKTEAEIKAIADRKVFFSSLKYGVPYSLFEPEKKIALSESTKVFSVCGIASPQLFEAYIKSKAELVAVHHFRDHHRYFAHEVMKLIQEFKKISTITAHRHPELVEGRSVFLTTEKDGVRLLPFKKLFTENEKEVYCLPVEVDFGAQKEAFESFVTQYLRHNNT